MEVENVILNWRQMDGDNELEKKLNAFLTNYFIINTAPSDECIALAQRLTALEKPNKEKVYKVLHASFGMGACSMPGSDEITEVDLTETFPRIEAELQTATTTVLAFLQLK